MQFNANEDAAPLDMLAALFEARDWAIESLTDEEITGEIQGSWAKYQLRGIWRTMDNVLQIVCVPDIRVPSDKRPAAQELLARVNEQMWLGHFDLWSNGGVVIYRHGALLPDDGMLSLNQAQALIESAVEDCDRFYPAFQFVLWGDKSPEAALEASMVDAAGEA
ncbi:hypothetical protein ELI_01835 [Erythrobacter litoralis HTCC2594]|uniref:YbjN domain-containing protein n=2 Tax=Erythrobacter litoralis TaxID=39960 RepID=Q2NCY2_ERYLH|nr:hypothetical protein ELI_01835 [Erythrobacter litoralis HTCC2594]